MGDGTVPLIGVLDLQGDVAEHLDHLARLGIEGMPVKEPAALTGLAGLIIPGGESTCLSRLMRIFGIVEAIGNEFRRGMKVWGTCAGAILLATEVVDEAPCLGLIDMVIERNSFGSQGDSFISEAVIPGISEGSLPLVFIRAPKILRVGPGVDVLLRIDDYIAAAESGEGLVTVFHPELTASVAFHRYFALKCGLNPYTPDRQPDFDPDWIATSWTRLARII
jgi:5'-phosphate synthase pdxT subunit